MNRIIRIHSGLATILAVFALASNVMAAQKDSSLFNHQYNGDFYPNFPGYTENPGGGTWAPATNGNGVLSWQQTILETGHWQSDDWVVGPNPAANATGWSIELRIRILNDAPDDPTGGAFMFFAKDGGNVTASRRVGFQVGRNFTKLQTQSLTIDTTENTNDFHVFRISQPANSSVVTIWRDGVQLYSGLSQGANNSTAAQMWWGDGSGGVGGPTVMVDYYRWDSAGPSEPVVVAPVVVTHPQNTTNIVGASVTLTAVFTNAITSLQWYKDNNPIGGATTFSSVSAGQMSTYNIPSLQVANEGTYYCTATNSAGFVNTTTAYLDAVPDTTPPTVVSNVVSAWASRVRVRFSEPMSPVSTAEPTNYVFQGGALSVASVTILDASRVDVFTTSRPLPGSNYVMEISNVQDTSTNAIAANTPVAFTVDNNFPARTNLLMAYNETSATPNAGGGVAWVDLSGNENHATSPSTPGPTFVANDLQGHGVFHFTPSSTSPRLRVLSAVATGLNQDNYTWFAVSRCSNMGLGANSSSLTPRSPLLLEHNSAISPAIWRTYYYIGGIETTNSLGQTNHGVIFHGRSNPGDAEVAAIVHPTGSNKWEILQGHVDNATGAFGRVVNPGPNTVFAATNTTAPLGLGLSPGDMSFGATFSGGQRFGGDVAEILIYTGTLSPSDLDAIENYLRTKYFTPDAPLAVTDPIARPAGAATKASIASLLANDTDADDGDVITFVSISASSTNGATVTTDAAYVYYVPTNSDPTNDVPDSFTYTIRDAHFLYATGVVLVTVAPAPNGITHNITGISTNGDGNYTISFAGIPNQTYVIEATTNIVTPAWSPIATNVAGLNGLWNYTDIEATNYPSRFYRTVAP